MGRLAISLAREYFFGDEVLATQTPGSLDKNVLLKQYTKP